MEKDYKKVIIIATNHAQGAYINGISIPKVTHYKTPLGEVEVSDIAEELLKEDIFVNVPEAHTTHVIEIELPFLQSKLNDFEIIPLVTGHLKIEQIKEIADILSRYIDSETLIVVSSDLSHYHPYGDAVKLDTKCIKDIESLNSQEAAKCEACSLYAIFILMELAQRNGWQGKIIDYKNSGDTAGDKSSVVGYSSIAFYEGNINQQEKDFLLDLARKTLTSYVKEKKVPLLNEKQLTKNLLNVQGCFVTFEKHGNLRGCTGDILPERELYKCVIGNSINSAVNDIRFNPVTEDELKDIEIEISILTVPKKLEYSSWQDLLDKLTPLKDGIVLVSNNSQATYLPQVWEQIPDKEDFLSYLCEKAKLTMDCWKNPDTEIFVYNAIVFGEH